MEDDQNRDAARDELSTKLHDIFTGFGHKLTKEAVLEAHRIIDVHAMADVVELPPPAERLLELEQEVDEYNALLSKLTDILTRTANALKGQPPDGSKWSWHDLPELVGKTVSVRDLVTVMGGPRTIEGCEDAVSRKFSGFRIENFKP